MKLFIPSIGTHMVTQQPWQFTLHRESRNMAFRNLLLEIGTNTVKQEFGDIIKAYDLREQYQYKLVLREGTILKVDRIYIRQNLSNFDSVTFRVAGRKNCRFWATLDDVNKLEVEIIPHGHCAERIADWQELRGRQAREAAVALSPVFFDSRTAAFWEDYSRHD